MADVTLSVGVPNFGRWAGGDWRGLIDVARAAEDAGIDRLIVNDHVVMGEHTDAYVWGRFPTGPDGPWLEPLTVIAAMAAVTSRIRFSTGILIAPLRPSTVLAKTVATLDVVSRGRLDLGVGVGWQREEYDAAGLDFATRGALLDDTIAACRALWSSLPAEPAGTLRATAIYCSPQPVQDRLPVWFSGTLNHRNLRRIVEWGDGWIPIMGSTAEDIREGAAKVRAAADRPITVQASLPVAVGADGSRDVAATFAGAGDFIDAGADDLYVNVAAFAGGLGDAPEALGAIAREFGRVAS